MATIEMKKIRSINNIKHDGEFHLPGTTWLCPADAAKTLIIAGLAEPAMISAKISAEKEIKKPAADNN